MLFKRKRQNKQKKTIFAERVEDFYETFQLICQEKLCSIAVLYPQSWPLRFFFSRAFLPTSLPPASRHTFCLCYCSFLLSLGLHPFSPGSLLVCHRSRRKGCEHTLAHTHILNELEKHSLKCNQNNKHRRDTETHFPNNSKQPINYPALYEVKKKKKSRLGKNNIYLRNAYQI